MSWFLFSGKFRAAASPDGQARCRTRRPGKQLGPPTPRPSSPICSAGARGGAAARPLWASLSFHQPPPPGSPRWTPTPPPRSQVTSKPVLLHCRLPQQRLLPHLPPGTNTSWPRARVQARPPRTMWAKASALHWPLPRARPWRTHLVHLVQTLVSGPQPFDHLHFNLGELDALDLRTTTGHVCSGHCRPAPQPGGARMTTPLRTRPPPPSRPFLLPSPLGPQQD